MFKRGNALADNFRRRPERSEGNEVPKHGVAEGDFGAENVDSEIPLGISTIGERGALPSAILVSLSGTI